MTAREQLLQEIEDFLRDYAMAPTVFGRKAVGDVAFVGRMRKGRNPKLDMADRVRKWIKDYRRTHKPRPNGSAARAEAA